MTLSKDQSTLVSNIEAQFVLEGLKNGLRTDLRDLIDLRSLQIHFTQELGQVQVYLGQNVCLATISAEITTPRKDNGNEGILFLNVEVSNMSAPGIEVGRTNETEVFISQMLEKSIRRSRAIDLESLCIVADEKVWAVRVDLRILDNDGNPMDCASIAAIAALLHFRRPEVTVSGEDVIVHTIDEKIPVPLTVHHAPLCISFAFFEQGKIIVLDPTLIEDTLKEGQLTLAMNVHRELCAISMAGGAPLLPTQILKCSQLASQKVQKISSLIHEAILKDYATKNIPFHHHHHHLFEKKNR